MASPGFQYTIRWILGLTAFVACCTRLATAQQSAWLGLLDVLILMLVPACSLVAVIVTKGYTRSFFAGALASLTVTVLLFVTLFQKALNQQVLVDLSDYLRILSVEFEFVWIIWLLVPVVGLLCVAFHWLVIIARPN